MDYKTFNDLVTAGKAKEIDDYARELYAKTMTNPAGFYVHDGAEQVFYTFAGNPMYERKFQLSETFNVGAVPVSSWRSRAPVEAGEFVQNETSRGTYLHFVLAAETVGSGYENRKTYGYSVSFKLEDMMANGFPAGVGRNGKQQRGRPQITFI